MANVDRPNGFRPVKTLSGAPVSGLIRTIGVADGADIFIGDVVNLEAGLADPGVTNDAAFLGVAVGFGMVDADGIPLGPFDPDNLNVRYYDDSANTHTDWVCYYIPVIDVLFEVQTDTALTLAVGATADIAGVNGSLTTGRSIMEITTSANADVTVIEIPQIVDNDPALVNGRYWVMFTRAEQAFHA